MTANLDMSNDRANIAFVGEVPWHGLGSVLTPGAPIPVWMKEAGLDWKIKRAPVRFQPASEGVGFQAEKDFDERNVLYRSDTLAPLSIVSDRYQIVQPADVLDFYRELVASADFTLETAGCLDGGRKFWALARTNREVRIMGQDLIKAYLLLATSCDGSLATTGKFTSVRVVCQNTLDMSMSGGGSAVRVPHSAKFDPKQVKKDLGLVDDAMKHFEMGATRLAQRKVSKKEAIAFFMDLFVGDEEEIDINDPKLAARIAPLMVVYAKGVGQDLRSTQDTAFGLVNAVTRYYDHERATRSTNNRLRAAWFGKGAAIKRVAWDKALQLAA